MERQAARAEPEVTRRCLQLSPGSHPQVRPPPAAKAGVRGAGTCGRTRAGQAVRERRIVSCPDAQDAKERHLLEGGPGEAYRIMPGPPFVCEANQGASKDIGCTRLRKEVAILRRN